MPPRTDRTLLRARDDFLAAVSRGLSITGAAIEAGVPRRTVYEWRDADADFASAWDDAIEAGTDLIEDEARRRAVEGCEKPVVAMGKIAKNDDGSVLMVREYSDSLMALLLKGRRAKKFRDNVSAELSGPNGGPISTKTVTLFQLPDNGRD